MKNKMFINTISSNSRSNRNPKRVGRGVGSGLGKTCGRGHKGQRSRSGFNINRGFEGGQTPLHHRIPKFGFSSKKSLFTEEVRLSDLEKISSRIVNINTLKSFNIIKYSTKFAKIILFGKITSAFTIQGIKVSNNARIMIESVGGKIEGLYNK